MNVLTVNVLLQYWISHGYDYFDRDRDEWAHHLIMFSFVTLPTVFMLLFVCYYPDDQSVSTTYLLPAHALHIYSSVVTILLFYFRSISIRFLKKNLNFNVDFFVTNV